MARRSTAAKQQPEHLEDEPEEREAVTLDELLAESAKQYEAGPLESMRRADLDAARAAAQADPRSLADFLLRLTEVCTLNATTAGACFYSLQRGGKTITGPSIRFAELVAYAWQHVRVSSVIISVDDRAVVINGVAHDMETNRIYEVATRRPVQRPKYFKDQEEYERKLRDLQDLAVAAATSVAIRNAILRLVPRALLEESLAKAKRASTGKGTIEEKRKNALEAFAELGAEGPRVLAAIGRKGIADITIDDLVHLAGLLTAVREGVVTLDDAMRTPEERASASRGRTSSTPMDLGVPPASNPTTNPGPGDDSQAP